MSVVFSSDEEKEVSDGEDTIEDNGEREDTEVEDLDLTPNVDHEVSDGGDETELINLSRSSENEPEVDEYTSDLDNKKGTLNLSIHSGTKQMSNSMYSPIAGPSSARFIPKEHIDEAWAKQREST
jgi:hypothetical protein